MKSARILKSVQFALFVSAVLIMNQSGRAAQDSIWFVFEENWLIDSQADSLCPPIQLWAISDWEGEDSLIAVSVGFEIKFDTTGFDSARWGVTGSTFDYVQGTYDRCWSSVDSHIVVDSFVLNPGLETAIRISGVGVLDTTLANDAAYLKWHYNGFNVGLTAALSPAALPDSVPTRIGNLYIKIDLKPDGIMPTDFDIAIDSSWFPPAGSFKFKRRGQLEGTPPAFAKAVVHVVADPALPSGADETNSGELTPGSCELLQNYPNPFNPATNIAFSLQSASRVRLEVYNIMGQKVATLADRRFSAGNHTVVFEGKDAGGEPVASGVYFYRIVTGNFTKIRKMLLLK